MTAGPLGPSPSDDPLSYPGGTQDQPFLLDHGDTRPLDVRTLDGGLVTGGHLVVAAGSNASPARLLEKLGPNAVVPVLFGRALGLDVRYSAHVARYGSVPATAWPVPGTSVPLPALLLDDAQLSALDATEPNYDRIGLGAMGAAFHVAWYLEGSVRLPPASGAGAYVSRHGWYRLPGGAPAVPPLRWGDDRRGTVVDQPGMLGDVLSLARSARPDLDLPDVDALLGALRGEDVDLTSRELTALLAASGRSSTEGRSPAA